jgi:hypothetical protein
MVARRAEHLRRLAVRPIELARAGSTATCPPARASSASSTNIARQETDLVAMPRFTVASSVASPPTASRTSNASSRRGGAFRPAVTVGPVHRTRRSAIHRGASASSVAAIRSVSKTIARFATSSEGFASPAGATPSVRARRLYATTRGIAWPVGARATVRPSGRSAFRIAGNARPSEAGEGVAEAPDKTVPLRELLAVWEWPTATAG